MDSPLAPDLHDDWRDLPNAGPFAGLIGPLQRRHNGKYWSYRLHILPSHANRAGILHGGLLAAFLDETIGSTVHQLTGRSHVTVQLNTNFLQAVKIGETIESDCGIVHGGKSMTFAQGRVLVDTRIVATATAVFKAVRPREA